MEALDRVLPEDWHADLASPPTLSDDPSLADALLTLSAPGGASGADFLVQAIISSRHSAAQLVENALRAGAWARLPVVLFLDYANPPLRALCEERGVGYIDTSGWVNLSSRRPATLIRTHGDLKRAGGRVQQSINRLDGPSAGRAIRTLAMTKLPAGVRDLAAQADVSPGTIAKILPPLTTYGAIERSSTGAVASCNIGLLIERWTQDYDLATSNRAAKFFIAPRGLGWLQDQISKIGTGLDLVTTGSLAARQYLPGSVHSVSPLTLACYYTTAIERTAAELRLRETDRPSANVALIEPRDLELMRPTTIQSTPPPAPWPQVAADLYTLGDRFPEEAEQLMDEISRSPHRFQETW